MSNIFSNVFVPVKVVRDKGVTNSLPLLVRIVLIFALFFLSNLIKSNDLYAAIPPPIIIKIFLFFNVIVL